MVLANDITDRLDTPLSVFWPRYENTGEPVRRGDRAIGSTFDNIGGRARIITDTETGVQYLFVFEMHGYSGMGGLTVLVDADGKPLIAREAR